MSNRVVIVTGGTRGIGFGIVRAFAATGASVIMNYLSNKERAEQALEELEPLSGTVVSVQANIETKEGRELLVSKTLSHFDRIDVLVNNAGKSPRSGFLKGSEADFDEMINCNLKGPYFLAQRVAQTMITAKQEGCIINICSTASHEPTCGAYSVAKAGLLMATKAMAYKLGPYGIRANSISPGFIKTDMNKRLWKEQPDLAGAHAQQLPLREMGTPNDVASAVLHLASESARYTTGTDLVVDGGFLLRGVRDL